MTEYVGEEGGIDAATGLEPGSLGGHMGHEMGLQRQRRRWGDRGGRELTAQEPGQGRKESELESNRRGSSGWPSGMCFKD